MALAGLAGMTGSSFHIVSHSIVGDHGLVHVVGEGPPVGEKKLQGLKRPRLRCRTVSLPTVFYWSKQVTKSAHIQGMGK